VDDLVLQQVHFRGYRSLANFRLKLAGVTVVTGENGVGKSNVYQALALTQKMAQGNFAAAIAREGGMPSLLWAGDRKKNDPQRLCWELQHTDFQFETECGMISSAPGDPSKFRTDPDMKLEVLRHGGAPGRVMASRKGPAIDLRSLDGSMQTRPLPIHAPESMLSEVRDGIRYPALTAVREILLSWRFYHHFSTGPESPLRHPTIGCWSPVLAENGGNLAANLQTLIESSRSEPLDHAVEMAFPGCQWSPVDDQGRFQLQLLRPGLKRWLAATELSDGTLRFFCLCAALLTTRPPPLLVINEPEASLHSDLMPALAELIAKVSNDSQILIVTHSQQLAAELATRCGAKIVDLVNSDGKTHEAGQDPPGRSWTFEENE
jgi:predicted ATPase